MTPIAAPPHRVLFLPGASGDPLFWQGVGQLLPPEWEKRFLAWPGLGSQPADDRIAAFADLVDQAAADLDAPSVIVAQSMGGIVALELALRFPERVTHLVLAATSGGLDIARFGAADWRADFLQSFPGTARWILEEKPDLSARLAEIAMPILLLWGDADPISPPAVGCHLATLIHSARLEILPGADHGFAKAMPDEVAERLLRFLEEPRTVDPFLFQTLGVRNSS